MAQEDLARLASQKDQVHKQLLDAVAAAAAQARQEEAELVATTLRELHDRKMGDHKQHCTILALIQTINATETDPAEAASPETWLFCGIPCGFFIVQSSMAMAPIKYCGNGPQPGVGGTATPGLCLGRNGSQAQRREDAQEQAQAQPSEATRDVNKAKGSFVLKAETRDNYLTTLLAPPPDGAHGCQVPVGCGLAECAAVSLGLQVWHHIQHGGGLAAAAAAAAMLAPFCPVPPKSARVPWCTLAAPPGRRRPWCRCHRGGGQATCTGITPCACAGRQLWFVATRGGQCRAPFVRVPP